MIRNDAAAAPHAGLEDASATNQKQASWVQPTEQEPLSGLSEHSLAALQQQHLISMLQSATCYLQSDLQLMQQQKHALITGGNLRAERSCAGLLAVDVIQMHHTESRRPWR